MKFLPVESEGEKQSAVYFTNTGDWGTTFSTLLDLMEILTAARLICRSGVCLHSPRLTSTHASALLKTISSPSDYFVKKRALLLLKRTLLQKAGEDMALGAVVAAVPRDKDFCADMTVLANSVLQAVSASWFQCVPVEPAASFFGGTSQHGEGGQKLDYVMLRAVSLVVVKSLEFQIQSAGGTEGVSTGIEVHEYLQALLGFLSQRGVPLKESSHLCSWYILVFGEQDDDMMEAAKAMLLLFLHYRASPSITAPSLTS
ncbi:protein Lines homolog 1 [Polymixia lowei]